MENNAVEQVVADKEATNTTSATEQTFAFSDKQDTTVSEVPEVKEESPVNLDDPKVKAYIEQVAKSLAEPMAQSMKDKRVQKTLDELAAKDKELAEYKALQDTESKRIREEALFQTELKAAEKKLTEQGVPDDVIEQTLRHRVELRERSAKLEAEAQRFYKDRDAIQAKGLRFEALESVAEEFPTLTYGEALRLADEIVEKAEEKNKLAFKYEILKRKVSPQLKKKEPQKIDSGNSNGVNPDGIPTDRAGLRKWLNTVSDADYKRLKPKIDEMISSGRIK